MVAVLMRGAGPGRRSRSPAGRRRSWFTSCWSTEPFVHRHAVGPGALVLGRRALRAAGRSAQQLPHDDGRRCSPTPRCPPGIIHPVPTEGLSPGAGGRGLSGRAASIPRFGASLDRAAVRHSCCSGSAPTGTPPRCSPTRRCWTERHGLGRAGHARRRADPHHADLSGAGELPARGLPRRRRGQARRAGPRARRATRRCRRRTTAPPASCAGSPTRRPRAG